MSNRDCHGRVARTENENVRPRPSVGEDVRTNEDRDEGTHGLAVFAAASICRRVLREPVLTGARRTRRLGAVSRVTRA